eukprot:CAMPEP_0178382754 /NCGR_PEP_ID=MMETSP0689_2-20121128/6652_1 /TAXON_ID=160604 /ORGANISM="Amphidinium massartii, Strain CS-259" /LENGTH=352 /DNA_ID=CAMNT_0020002959 /DNA_START=85 /DNA_END=1143 /DNA_ORIENTATION=-
MSQQSESSIRAYFDFIHVGDLAGVRSLARESFDLNCHNPVTGETALQAIVVGIVRRSKDLHKEFFDLARWLVQRGADPTLEAIACRAHPTYSYSFSEYQGQKIDSNDTAISFTCAQHSAMSLLAQVKKDIFTVRNAKPWTFVLQRLASLVEVFAEAAPRHTLFDKVGVDPSVLDVWDKLRSDEATHDLVLETEELNVTAHANVLAAASPVVAAMLSSGMGEAISKRVKVDCPAEGVLLLLDLVYTGTSCKPFSASFGLPALDLAHRWQLTGVVHMLERAAIGALCAENFAETAEAAVLKDLEVLKRECEKFAQETPEVRKAKKLPSIVRAWLEGKQQCSPQVNAGKKQRISY